MQPECLAVERTADGDQDLVNLDRGAALEEDPLDAAVRFDARHLDARTHLDAFGLEHRANRSRGFRLLSGEDARSMLDQRDLYPEAGKNLGKLRPDRSGADDRQAVWKLFHL